MSTSHTQKQAKQNRTEQNLSVIVFIITILLGENAKGSINAQIALSKREM